MPDVKIRAGVWKGLQAAAQRQGQRPEALANRALAEYLERLSDEELLSRSQTAGRRAPLQLSDTERAIRRFRNKAQAQ